MAHGAPDFWTTTTPAMPVIGAGQIVWFQSENQEVGLGSHKDLINYVVPDNMELHVCSGIVSCDFPVHQRYDLRITPAATWISPTSHSDPDSKWLFEENAYDGDTATIAPSAVGARAWGSFLILLVNEQNIDKIRFYAPYDLTYINKIDVWVFYGGIWVNVDEAAFADREWVEWDIAAGASLISKARVRFYNTGPAAVYAYLNEFMFNTAEVTPQKGVWFDTHAIIPFTSQAPYIVPSKATFAVRVHNDDDADHYMGVNLAGFLTSIE